MAVRNPVVTRPSQNTIQFAYTLNNTDTGTPIHEQHADFSDRVVHWSGTFGTGGSVTIEGSGNGASYVALTDPQGNALTKTAAGVEQIMEGFPLIRPNCTAGDGTTAIVVTIICRRPRVSSL